MNGTSKTEPELIEEISALKKRIEELERSEAEHKRAEEELRFSRQQLRLLIDAGSDFFFLKDLDLRYQLVNSANAQFLGRDEADILGRTDVELMPEGAAASCQESDRLAIREKRTVVTIEPVGEKFYETRKFPVIVAGEVVGVAGIVHDITERKRSEEALRSHQLQLAEAMDLAHMVYWESDPLAETYTFNDPFYALYSTTAEQEGGYRMTKEEYATRFIHPDDLATYYQFVEGHTLRPRDDIADIERRIVRRDGEVRHILTRARIVKDDSGRVIKRYGANQDITERKRMEEALRKSEERYRRIIETAREGIVINDEDVKFTFVNKRFADMLGYRPEELIGTDPTDYTFEEDIKEISERRERHGQGVFEPFERRFRRKDGTVLWTHITMTPMTDEDGRPEGTFAMHTDITSRKQAEEALRESEARLKSILRAAPVGVGTVVNRVIIQANDSLCAMTGHTQGELLRQNARLLYPTDEDFNFVGREKYRQINEHGTGTVETRWLRKDGRIIDVLLSSTPLDLEDLQKGVIFTALDITERKHLESQLIQSQKMEAIGTLAGGVAHDFNNILTAIIGFAAILQMDMEKDNPKRAYLDQILAAAQKATNLTQSLLAFSRKQQIDLKPHRINDIIEQTTKLLKRLLTEDIGLKVALTSGNPSVMADITQMDQILINLATNARDAMPKGGILRIETGTVSLDDEFIRVQGYGEPGNYAVLTVSDTGVGMDKKTKEHIFEPFFTTKEVGKGTGLGLSTVYGLVKQHNGYITVDSELNKGTMFRIYFPLVYSGREDSVPVAQDAKKGTETILVAEDDPGVRTLIVDILRRYGYTPIEATDGVEALRLFMNNKDKVSLVICDVVMPKMNGKEVCEEIKRTSPTTRILFTSGYTRDVIIDKGVEDATVDFITKPINPREFLTKVREVLDR